MGLQTILDWLHSFNESASPASSQHWRCIDAGAQCKWALIIADLLRQTPAFISDFIFNYSYLLLDNVVGELTLTRSAPTDCRLGKHFDNLQNMYFSTLLFWVSSKLNNSKLHYAHMYQRRFIMLDRTRTMMSNDIKRNLSPSTTYLYFH